MAIHTANLRLVNLNGNTIVYKNGDSTIGQISKSNSDFRVFEYQSGSAPSAAQNNAKTAPTVHEYLEAEAALGFELVHMDQTFIITSDGEA